MTIEIGEVWHPSRGVNQASISLGRRVNLTLNEAICRFEVVPGVDGAGATGTMWERGHIDLKLSRPEWTSDLRANIARVCQGILRDG
jgi:hypothetical protein